jgi:lactoylglutathione lyase
MQSKLFRITLNSSQPDLLLRFYSLLGFQFSQKSIDKGSRAWQGQLGDVSLEVFGILETYSNKVPGVQMSFNVKGLDSLVAQFRMLNAQIMMEPLDLKTGKMAIVMDPDGRSVELIQE